jgi:hypothetical protein
MNRKDYAIPLMYFSDKWYPFGHEHLAQLSDPDQLAGKNIS